MRNLSSSTWIRIFVSVVVVTTGLAAVSLQQQQQADAAAVVAPPPRRRRGLKGNTNRSSSRRQLQTDGDVSVSSEGGFSSKGASVGVFGADLVIPAGLVIIGATSTNVGNNNGNTANAQPLIIPGLLTGGSGQGFGLTSAAAQGNSTANFVSGALGLATSSGAGLGQGQSLVGTGAGIAGGFGGGASAGIAGGNIEGASGAAGTSGLAIFNATNGGLASGASSGFLIGNNNIGSGQSPQVAGLLSMANNNNPLLGGLGNNLGVVDFAGFSFP